MFIDNIAQFGKLRVKSGDQRNSLVILLDLIGQSLFTRDGSNLGYLSGDNFLLVITIFKVINKLR